MKKYICHKKVHAFKLDKIAGTRLIGEDPADFVDVSPIFIVQHNLLIKAGCYIVVYEDSYVSVSPIDAFESGYSELEQDEEPQDSTQDAEKEPEMPGLSNSMGLSDSLDENEVGVASETVDWEERRAFIVNLNQRDREEYLGGLSDEEYGALKVNDIIDDDHQVILNVNLGGEPAE